MNIVSEFPSPNAGERSDIEPQIPIRRKAILWRSHALSVLCPTPMSEDASFEWLVQQLRQLLNRVERCEGKMAQLEATSIRPGLSIPSRRELQQLDERVNKLENGK